MLSVDSTSTKQSLCYLLTRAAAVGTAVRLAVFHPFANAAQAKFLLAARTVPIDWTVLILRSRIRVLYEYCYENTRPEKNNDQNVAKMSSASFECSPD